MTPTAERKAPNDIYDVEELRREIRIAATNGDNERCKDLRVRHQQWREQHAAEIEAAQQKRQERDAETIRRQAAADRLAKLAREGDDWEAETELQLRFEESRAKDKKHIDEHFARKQAEFERDKKAQHIQNLNRENKKLRSKTK